MTPIEITVPWLPYGARAMTFWPLIMYRPGCMTPCIRVHERWHWDSQGKWGPLWPLTWGLLYQVLNIPVLLGKKRPEWHPMERNAYRVMRECEDAAQRP